MNILIMTPPGKTITGEEVFYSPSRWSAATGDLKGTTFYPINLAYLSSLLKQRVKEHKVRLIDTSYFGVDMVEYIDIINTLSPDVLIIEVDFLLRELTMEAVTCTKKRNNSCKIILCGPYPTINPEKCLELGADFVAIGEFEGSICKLIEGGFQKNSPGIYPDTKPFLIDVNTLPYPEDSDIKRRNYCRTYYQQYNCVEVFATRGCPYTCDFCVARNIYYQKPSFRTRVVSSVIEEIEYLFGTIPGLEGIIFNEETHTADKKYTMKLCSQLIQSGLHEKKYSCMTSYNSLDKELLAIMKEAGYYKIMVGVESLDLDTQSFLQDGKKSNSEKLFEVLKICRELDILVYVTITVGAEGSCLHSDYQTIRIIQELHEKELILDFQVSINRPMPGTPFYKRCEKNGWLKPTQCDLFPESNTLLPDYPDYPIEQIFKVFNYAKSLATLMVQTNVNRGVNYSVFDGEVWCKPVYDLKYRKKGTGIIDGFKW